MRAAEQTLRVPKERKADPRYVEDYRRAYKDAWEIAWTGLRWDTTHRQPDKMVAWAHDIAHKVALDYAETELRWRSY